MLAGLALNLAGPAKRHFPEAAAFIADLIESFGPNSSSTPATAAAEGSRPRRSVAPGLMAFEARGNALAEISPAEVSPCPAPQTQLLHEKIRIAHYHDADVMEQCRRQPSNARCACPWMPNRFIRAAFGWIWLG